MSPANNVNGASQSKSGEELLILHQITIIITYIFLHNLGQVLLDLPSKDCINCEFPAVYTCIHDYCIRIKNEHNYRCDHCIKIEEARKSW